MERTERRWILLVVLAVAVASCLPYLIAWAAAPAGTRFTGLILNPQDGHSYLAKMRQGYAGSWHFRLPYTPETHTGGVIYVFYLLLGHLARVSGLSLIVVFHVARLLGGVTMLLVLYGLARRFSSASIPRAGEAISISEASARGERRTMFWLATFGAGLGWLMGGLGVTTADLWVPEAFPWYALLVNAHFPLAIGLMATIVVCALELGGRNRGAGAQWGCGLLVSAVALGLVQPFGLVTVFSGLAVWLVARAVRRQAIPHRAWGWTIAAGMAALPYPIYMLVAIRSDPILAAWSAQNVTTSPPWWDWMLSYGLVLLLAIPGAVVAVRRGADADWLVLGWAGATLVGLYLPLPLQRRLSLGFGVPLGLLAGLGWWRMLRPHVTMRWRGPLQIAAVAFIGLTPAFLVLGTLMSAMAAEPWYYLSNGEWSALQWLRESGRPDAVVLCAPQTGVFVPAWAGQRVVYGHAFETVRADERLDQVQAYWAGTMDSADVTDFLHTNAVGYVLVGPREKAIGGAADAGVPPDATLAFEHASVTIYELGRE